MGRDITVATTGVKMDGAPLTVDAPPPQLGQDNAEIWGALGVSAEALDALKRAGTI